MAETAKIVPAVGAGTGNKKRARKPKSAARQAAELAVSNLKKAGSDQEKAAARGHLKIVRFNELGPARVNRALKALDSVMQLANRGAYTYSDEQAAKLVNALTARVKKLADRFSGAKEGKESFTF